MKVMVCIPMEVSCDTTGRKELKDATAKRLLDEGLDNVLKANLASGFFLVRKPEKVPGFGPDGKPE